MSSIYTNVWKKIEKFSGIILFFVTDVSVVSLCDVGTIYSNIKWWLVGGRMSSVVGMGHITNGCNELVSWICTRCEGLDWIPQGTYDGRYSYWIEYSTYGNA